MAERKAAIVAVKDVTQNPKVFQNGHWQEFTSFEAWMNEGYTIIHSAPLGGAPPIAATLVVLEK